MRKRNYIQLSGGKLASKALGGIREILLARFFGTGSAADAYRGSLTLALSSMHIFTRVLQACFIPLYVKLDREEKEKAWALFQSLLIFFLGLGVILTLALVFLAGPLVRLVLHGFDAERAALTIVMLRITAFGIPAYIYCSLLGALGAAQNHFAIPAFRPGIQNLGMLVMIIAAALLGRPTWAAFGFTGAYWIMAVGATIVLFRANRLPPRWVVELHLVRDIAERTWCVARPLLLLSGVLEISILFERYIASLLGGGRIAAVDYARFVTETAHTLVVVPLGLMSLTWFANLSAEEMHRKADKLLAILFFAMIPLSAYLFMNGREILSILYFHGEFNLSSLLLTERALIGLTVGLWIYSASFLLQRILNARMENGAVLRAETIAVCVNILFLTLFFRRLGILAIGLGTALGYSCSLIYYLFHLRLRFHLARRGFLITAGLLLPYLALSIWGHAIGEGRAAFFIQTVFSLLFWGGAVMAVPWVREFALDRRRSETK